MICPYRLSTVITNDTSEEKDNKRFFTRREDYFEAICQQENCGAWDKENNKCSFNKEMGE